MQINDLIKRIVHNTLFEPDMKTLLSHADLRGTPVDDDGFVGWVVDNMGDEDAKVSLSLSLRQ